MRKQDDKRRRAKYTLEFKLEAVRLVKGAQDAAVTARVLDIPKATLGHLSPVKYEANWRAGQVSKAA